jgi:hypothetical protein
METIRIMLADNAKAGTGVRKEMIPWLPDKASKTTRQFVPIGKMSELINRPGMKTTGWRNFIFS